MKKNKLLIALSLSVFLASCSAGFIACSKNNTDSDGGVDKSGAVDYESEYVWKYTPEFSDPCDEYMTIDGVLDEDVWTSSERKWLSIGGNGASVQYSTYFTKKGLYVAAKVKDEKKLHWEARYNFSLAAGENALNSAFSITIAGKIDDGAGTFSKFIYSIDPKDAVSYQQSRFTAKATTDIDVDTGRATEMYAELFVTWESIYADVNEETGMPDLMYIYPQYRQAKDVTNAKENAWISPLYVEEWRYQTYVEFNEYGNASPEDPDAFWGNSGNGEPRSSGWDISLNSSDGTVTSSQAHSQAIFAQNYYTDRYVFSVDMTVVNGIYIKGDADGIFRAGVCAETEGRKVVAMLFFGEKMENGLAHVARLDRASGWDWKDPIAKKTYSDYDYAARNKTFNITVIKDLDVFYYIVEGELLCSYSEPLLAGKCSPGVYTLSSVAKYSNPEVKDYAGDEAGIKAEIAKYAHRITLPESVSGGTMTASSCAVDKAETDAKVKFTATTQPGYVLSSVKVNGEEKIGEIQKNFVDGSFELSVTEDIEVEPKFSKIDRFGDVIKLQGTLYAADGKSTISGAEVKVYDPDNALFEYKITTNSFGRFEVTFLKPQADPYQINAITYAPSGNYTVSVEAADGLRKFQKTYSSALADDKGIIELEIFREKSLITDKVTNTATNKTYTSVGSIDRSDEENGHIVIGKGTNGGMAWINMCESDAIVEFKVKNQLDCTVSGNEVSPAVGLYIGDGTDARLKLLLLRDTVWVLPSGWSDERYELGKTFGFDIRGTENYIHLRYIKSGKAIVLQYNTGTAENPVWEELFSSSFESLDGKQLYGFTALSDTSKNLSVDIKDINVTKGNEAATIAKEYLSRNVTLQVENKSLGKATIDGVTDEKANLGSTITVNLETENGAYVSVNGETMFYKGNSTHTFTVKEDSVVIVRFVKTVTYSVELDKSIERSKLSATLNGLNIPISKVKDGYTVAVPENAILTFGYKGYCSADVSPSNGKYIVPAFTLREVDIAYSQGAQHATTARVDDGISVSATNAIAFSAYISESEQVQGKSFIVETKIATLHIDQWHTYGVAIRYSEGKFLTLGVSLRGTPLKLTWLNDGTYRGEKDFADTTEAQAVKNNYKAQEDLLLKVLYDASAKKYYVFGNGVLLGEFAAENLGVTNEWGDVTKVGFGARLDDKMPASAEFRSWKFITDDESEYHTLACTLGIHETEVIEKKATCTENGERKVVCKHCHKEIEKEILVAHHTDENKDGVCDVCGNKLDISYGKKESDGDTTGKDLSDW